MARDLILGTTNRDWSLGSIFLPERQKRRVREMVDDVRYDVRRLGRGATIGLLCLSGAVGLAALASVYRTSRGA
jgi:16S rRNA U516 pseudouridylate synthase RsuA-like enzyme